MSKKKLKSNYQTHSSVAGKQLIKSIYNEAFFENSQRFKDISYFRKKFHPNV